MDMSLSKLGDSEGQESLACMSMGSQRVGHDLVTEQQQLIVEQACNKHCYFLGCHRIHGFKAP